MVAAACGLAALAACSDALEQTTSAGQVVVDVSAVSATLTLVRVDNHTVTTLPVPPAGSTPASAAARGGLLVVPGGDSATLAVFDFSTGGSPAVMQWRLPAGSAGGVALESDSIAWVTNPGRNRVTRINVRRGDTVSTAVGVSPVAVAVAGSHVYVVDANLLNGAPAGPSWITVLDVAPLPPHVTDSIALSGTNARSITVGADGSLYVVDAGTQGRGDGKLSIVDTLHLVEEVVMNGLGESPGPAVYHPSGRLLIASPSGVLDVNTSTRMLTHGAVVDPGGTGVAVLALDQAGRLYAYDRRACTEPSQLHVLSAPPDYDQLYVTPAGVCPLAATTIVVP